jgi:hypothetical protein
MHGETAGPRQVPTGLHASRPHRRLAAGGHVMGRPMPSRLPSLSRNPGGAPAGRGGAGVVAFDGSDSVGRVQARQIVFLEGDPASPKFGDGRIEVIDFPRHLGVFARWGAGGLEEGEFTASAAVAQTPRGVPRLVAGQAGWRRSVVPAAGPAPGVGSRRRRARGLSRTESDSRCILHGRIRRCSTRPG